METGIFRDIIEKQTKTIIHVGTVCGAIGLLTKDFVETEIGHVENAIDKVLDYLDDSPYSGKGVIGSSRKTTNYSKFSPILRGSSRVR